MLRKVSLQNTRPGAQRRGLTLIELIVVLTILVALAALLIPMLPNMLSRSHDASAATNISEISKYVQTYNQLYFNYPNNLDNLVDAGAGGGNLLATLAGGGNLNTQVVAQALTAPQVTALNNIGITSLANLTGTDPGVTGLTWSPTFFPYTTTNPRLPANTTAVTTATPPTVAVLTGTTGVGGTAAPGTGVAAAVVKLGVNPSGTYVVLGFGLANSAIGQVVQECPAHFPDQATISPSITYQRYGLIFKVSDPAVTNFTNAVFVGTVCLLDDGIESANDHIKGYFDLSQQQ
jgi:prepilin-type N-terminal cleavage/methylation domain-containing protein